jgi:hypothetical protein
MNHQIVKRVQGVDGKREGELVHETHIMMEPGNGQRYEQQENETNRKSSPVIVDT